MSPGMARRAENKNRDEAYIVEIEMLDREQENVEEKRYDRMHCLSSLSLASLD